MIKEPRIESNETKQPSFRVRVHFYSYFKTLVGCADVEEEIAAGTKLGQLFDRLADRFPKLGSMQKSTLMAVGVDYQPAEYEVKAGDEVSFFPPVQGG
jgi:molybdopterin converting factor small subunit